MKSVITKCCFSHLIVPDLLIQMKFEFSKITLSRLSVIYDSHFLSGFSQGAQGMSFSRTKCVQELFESHFVVRSKFLLTTYRTAELKTIPFSK